MNTLEKIKDICNEELHSPYPVGTQHFEQLRGLFAKRDRLVHSKPRIHSISIKPVDYDNLASAYADYIDASEEITFIYENLDEEMKLYSELKRNLQICSGRPEPHEEQLNNLLETISNQMYEMCSKMFS